MTRYYFHIYDGKEFLDSVGTELADLPSAQRQAIQVAGELLRNYDGVLANGEIWKIEVAEDSGRILIKLQLQYLDP